MAPELIAVLDVGKTHSKLTLVEAESGTITWSAQRDSEAIPGAFRQLDAPGIEKWLLERLRAVPGKEHIHTIVPVAHGAAAALVDARGQVLALPDYEDPVFDSVRADYLERRDPFSSTYSPALSVGLNLGIQLYYLQRHHADLFERAETILLYPQYWAWRLCGVMAREITSLGCHTDLWLPGENRFSQLAAWQEWAELFPSMRRASDVLGTVTAEVTAATGLDGTCRVLCGIHDSNASYLCHRASRPAGGEPFVVVSSGTWIVIMAHGADLPRLQEQFEMLANVNALGDPVPTARFMGGREYEAIAASAGGSQHPTLADLTGVLEKQAFAHAGGKLVNADSLKGAQRAALATLYCTLQTDLLLDRLGVSGTIIVDGPFATNPLYGPLLAAYRAHSRVLIGGNRAGPVECARLLSGQLISSQVRQVAPLEHADLPEYRALWRASLITHQGR